MSSFIMHWAAQQLGVIPGQLTAMMVWSRIRAGHQDELEERENCFLPPTEEDRVDRFVSHLVGTVD